LNRYGALGDGRSVALVGVNGSIDWWSVPNLDSTPLFDRLLDPDGGGRFAIIPVGDFAVERRYRTDSNVLEHTFTTAGGRARLTDSLNSGTAGRLPWSELARRIEGLEGSVEFRVEAFLGRRLNRPPSWRQSGPDGGILHIDGLLVALRGEFERLEENDRGVSGRLTTSSGTRDVLVILASADAPLILPTLPAIDARIDRSDQTWREWARTLTFEGPFAEHVRRSALALKLLVFAPTGAIAAAATTSLPERLGGDKNYDYRYAWVRDVCYSIKAFLRVGVTEEAQAAFSWLTTTLGKELGRLCVMFKLDGTMAPEERELDLPGYANSSPVRLGNRARDQLQLGIFGDILETAALFVERGHVLDLTTRRLLKSLVNQCAISWRQKDAGIWELSALEHYTMSKMGCWTALDRAVRLAEQGQIDAGEASRWAQERDRIREWIDLHCWSEPKRAYTLYPGTERLDASLLLGSRFGFASRDRLIMTRDAIRQELCRGALVYRYSGMADEEGTFTACGYWLVEAFALVGERELAIRQMQAMLEASGDNLGLLSEQIDPDTGAMLGNMPQALSHLALIHAAVSLTEG